MGLQRVVRRRLVDVTSSQAGPAGDCPRFAVVGAYVIDCIARTDRMPEWGESYQGESVHMAPGGKALNMAVALARMGAHVDAIGVVGDDLAGQTVVDALVKEGVGIEGLEVRPGGRTPICVCFSRTDGETAFLWHIDDSVAMDASTINGAGRGPLVAADTTIVTFESPAVVGEAITLAKGHDGFVVVNPAPTNSAVDVAALPWKNVDLLVPNELEARSLLWALRDDQVVRPRSVSKPRVRSFGCAKGAFRPGMMRVLAHAWSRIERHPFDAEASNPPPSGGGG